MNDIDVEQLKQEEIEVAAQISLLAHILIYGADGNMLTGSTRSGVVRELAHLQKRRGDLWNSKPWLRDSESQREKLK